MPPTATASAATLSPDGLYRYRLTRTFTDLFAEGPPLVFVMLNPSTADATTNDQTTRRCMTLAAADGAAGITLVNLYAFRATDPRALAAILATGTDMAIGPGNDDELHEVAATCRLTGTRPVAAFGGPPPGMAPASFRARVAVVARMFRGFDSYGTTATGWPRHPSRLPNGVARQPWSVPG